MDISKQITELNKMNLSPDEMNKVDQILRELAKRGNSQAYEQLLSPYYDEIPVSIDRFIDDDDYLGKSTNQGKDVFPYWRNALNEILHGGKSYEEVIFAGCVEADTKIPLMDGTNPTIFEMYNHWMNGKRDYWTYSYDHRLHRIVPGKVSNVYCAGVVKVYEIVFDDGSVTKCSWDHKFLLRNGQYKYARDLVEGDSIMPLNRYINNRGYEVVRNPQKDGTYVDEKTFHLSYDYKKGVSTGAIHHKNFNKLDNRPENLVRIPGRVHYLYHSKHSGEKLTKYNNEHPTELLDRLAKGRATRWCGDNNEEYRREASLRMSSRNKDPEFIKKQLDGRITSGDIERKRLARIKYNKTKAPRVRRILEEYTDDQIISAVRTSYNLDTACNKLGMSHTGLSSCMNRLGLTNDDFLPLPEVTNHMQRRMLNWYNKLYNEHGYLTDELVANSGYYKIPKVTKFVNDKFNGNYERFISVVSNYNHKVVSVRKTDEEMLVYDLTVEEVHNFAMIPATNGNENSCVFCHNAIGLGKSWNACIIGAYLLYRLLCMKNPQSYYGLAANTPIVFAFFNIHKYLSLDVAYGQFQRFLQDSPWFLRHGEIRGVKNREYFPEKNIEFLVGCNEEHAIGKNIFFAMLDEMSFAKHANVDILKSGIMKLYRSVQTRMTSRFMRDGILLAKAVLISSKKSDSDFLDQYAMKQKGKPGVYIVDEPHWVVKPQAYSNKTFRLAVGSKNKKSVCLDDNDPRTDAELINEGYMQILHPPAELRAAFEFDMDAKLRDLAGVSTTVFTKFIAYDKLKRCYSNQFQNAFTNSQPVIGLDDPSQLWDYFDLSRVPDWVKALPGFLHLDIAYSGDGYGMGYIACAGVKTQFKEHIGEQATDPVYIHVFGCSIKAPKGSQVSLEKVRQFIYWLKFTNGFNLRSVSTDGFMSADTRQAMITRGIDAALLSLDKKPDGYLALKNAIYEKRTTIVEDELLEEELIHLERNEMTGKIDHPQSGSKDMADGLAGALWNASLHQDEYSMIPHSIEVILDVNKDDLSIEDATTEELEAQLTNFTRKKEEKPESLAIKDTDDIDTVVGKVVRRPEESQSLTDEQRMLLESMGIVVW